MSREPLTADEWQEAADAARALLLLESARAYGLVTGGPVVDVPRCEALLRRARTLGIVPASDQSLASRLASELSAVPKTPDKSLRVFKGGT